jgi:hypothetical protein
MYRRGDKIEFRKKNRGIREIRGKRGFNSHYRSPAFRDSQFNINVLRCWSMKTALIYENESYQIIGACFEVYREKGYGFLEPFTRNAWRLSYRAQVQNYLKATGLKLGLLANFGHYPKIQLERIVAERGRYKQME